MLKFFHSTALKNVTVPFTPDVPNDINTAIVSGVIIISFLAILFAITTIFLLVVCFIKQKQKVGVTTTELTDRLDNNY